MRVWSKDHQLPSMAMLIFAHHNYLSMAAYSMALLYSKRTVHQVIQALEIQHLWDQPPYDWQVVAVVI